MFTICKWNELFCLYKDVDISFQFLIICRLSLYNWNSKRHTCGSIERMEKCGIREHEEKLRLRETDRLTPVFKIVQQFVVEKKTIIYICLLGLKKEHILKFVIKKKLKAFAIDTYRIRDIIRKNKCYLYILLSPWSLVPID